MLTKTYAHTGRVCRVTFHVPPGSRARTAALCGDFNDWDPDCSYMEPDPDGGFTLSLMLHPGRQYRFRYLLDGRRWEVDNCADGYVANRLGGDDSVVIV